MNSSNEIVEIAIVIDNFKTRKKNNVNQSYEQVYHHLCRCHLKTNKSIVKFNLLFIFICQLVDNYGVDANLFCMFKNI